MPLALKRRSASPILHMPQASRSSQLVYAGSGMLDKWLPHPQVFRRNELGSPSMGSTRRHASALPEAGLSFLAHAAGTTWCFQDAIKRFKSDN